MSLYVEPSASEQRIYEGTKLLFRSSQEPVGSCQRHALAAVHSSASLELCTQWNDSESTLRQGIMAILRTEHLRGVTFVDTYRQAKAWGHEKKDLGTSLLVIIALGKMGFKEAFEVGRGCLRAVRACGFNEVKVDVIEGEYVGRQHIGRRNILNDDPVPQKSYAYGDERFVSTKHISGSISPLSRPSSRGTKGIFMKLTFPTREVKHVFVTCRHVVDDDSMEPSTTYLYAKGDPKKGVIQPSDDTLQRVITMYEHRIRDLTSEIPEIRRQIQKEHQKSCELDKERLQKERNIGLKDWAELAAKRSMVIPCPEADETQKELEVLQAKLPDLRAWVQDPRTRIIGHVLFSPAQAAMDENTKHLRDYAIIELDPAAHKHPLDQLKSLVPAGDLGRVLINEVIYKNSASLFESSSSGQASTRPLAMPQNYRNATLRPQGLFSLEELTRPGVNPPLLERSNEPDDDLRALVAMFGSSSGFSIGFVNSAKIITRQLTDPTAADAHKATASHVEYKRMQDTEELCAVRPRCEGSSRVPFNNRFTRPGDSGAAVLNGIDGKWVGMVTGGYEGREDRDDFGLRQIEWMGVIDVTIITPFEWLLKDIEKELGCTAEIV